MSGEKYLLEFILVLYRIFYHYRININLFKYILTYENCTNISITGKHVIYIVKLKAATNTWKLIPHAKFAKRNLPTLILE